MTPRTVVLACTPWPGITPPPLSSPPASFLCASFRYCFRRADPSLGSLPTLRPRSLPTLRPGAHLNSPGPEACSIVARLRARLGPPRAPCSETFATRRLRLAPRTRIIGLDFGLGTCLFATQPSTDTSRQSGALRVSLRVRRRPRHLSALR